MPFAWCGVLGGLLTYQLLEWGPPLRGYNGYRGSGFDPGEEALKIASTSKDGSRRATFPMGKP